MAAIYQNSGRASGLQLTGKPHSAAFLEGYNVCDTCGFRLMRVEAPRTHTAPFLRLHCPICGYLVNEDIYRPGQAISAEMRFAAFEEWLQEQGLSNQVLEQRYHLSLADFFVIP